MFKKVTFNNNMIVRWIASIARWCWVIAITVLVVAAIYISLAREFFPLLAPNYKADLEYQLNHALQIPITLQVVDGQMVRFNPQLIIRDLQIGNQTTIKRINIEVDMIGSVIAQKLRLKDVQVDGMQTTLIQVENGWKLGDVLLPNRGDDDFSWVESLSDIHINESQINIELNNNKKFSIEKTTLKLNQLGSQQRVATDIVMPNHQVVTILAEGRGAWTDVNDMQWDLYANIPDMDWLPWLQETTDDYVTIKKLQGGGQFWAQWREGKIDDVRVRANIPSLDWQYASNNISESVQALHVDLVFQRQSNAMLVSAPLLSFMWREKPYSLGGWVLSKKNIEGRSVFAYEAKQLNVDSFLPMILASKLLPAETQKALEALKPSGDIEEIQAVFYSSTQNKILDFTGNGKLKNVSIQAWHGSPAISGIDGVVEFNERGGNLKLDSQQFALTFPHLFEKGWQFHQAKGDLYWFADNQKFTIRSGLLNLSNNNVNVFGQFDYTSPYAENENDHLGLQLGFRNINVAHRMEFIPTKEVDPDLVAWLTSAITEGSVIEGAYLYDGPTIEHSSVYAAQQIILDVADVTVKFDQNWPALEKVNGSMVYNNDGLTVQVAAANLLTAELNNINVTLPHGEYDLNITARARSKVQTVMELLRTTPLHEEIGNALDNWVVDGGVTADIALVVPLNEKTTQVDVRSVLTNTQLTIPDVNLGFKNINGDLRYSSSSGLNSQQLTAQMTTFDAPIVLSIDTPLKDKTLTARLRTKGSLTVDQLAAWQPSVLWSYVQGVLPYNLELQIPMNHSSTKPMAVVVTSSLQGTVIKLPKPFGKKINEERQLAVTTLFNEKNYRIDATLNNEDVRAIVLMSKLQEPLQANVYLGATTTLSNPTSSGVWISGKTPNIVVDEWISFLAAEKKASKAGVNVTTIDAHVDINVTQLQAFDEHVANTQLTVVREGPAWKVGLNSAEVSGDITLPDNHQQPYDIYAKYIKLPAPQATSTASARADMLATINPNQLPAMQVKIDNFIVGNDQYGKWYFTLHPIKNGVDIKNIQIENMKYFSVLGKQASWTKEKNQLQSKTFFKGSVKTKDLNTALQAWGYDSGIESKEARFNLDLVWPGSPAFFSLTDSEGTLKFEFDNGRFVDMGGKADVLKIFGALNPSTLTRRLTANFSDLFKSGVSYDEVRGNLSIDNNVATFIEPATITGPSSDFKITGNTNLKTGEVNQEVIITPPIGQNAAVVATILCGPACGGITYVVQKVLGSSIQKFSSLKYRVTGSLENPVMEDETIFRSVTPTPAP